MEIVACKVDGCSSAVAVKKWQLCKSHYNRWKYAGDYEKTVAPALCKGCGVVPPRVMKHGGAAQFCSKECRYEYQRAIGIASGQYERAKSYRREARVRKEPSVQGCLVCDGPFESVRGRKFCSKKCSNSHYRNLATSHMCILEDCARPVVAKEMCSPHYKRWMRAAGRTKKDPWDERRKANWLKRDALKRGAGRTEKVVPSLVFERDGWMCGLCGVAIDKSLPHPDPWSVSLDHVVPLSKGGQHSLGNVQAAHLTCNLSKGNRVELAQC